MVEFFQLSFAFLCLFGHAFFAGMETGVTAINRLRLKHFLRQGEESAEILHGFLDDSDRLLGTTLLGTNICLIVVSVFAASLAGKGFGGWGEPLSVLIVSVVVLVFCDYIPKAWFSSNPYFRAKKFAAMLRAADKLLRPLSFIMIAFSRILVPGAKKTFAKPLPFVSREDLKMLTKDGEKSGVLSRRETWMIHRVFELSAKKAGQIMVPREKMITVDSDMTVDDFLELARKSGLTRMPVRDRQSGEFTGIINVLHVLASLPGARNRKVGEISRPPQFIPAAMPVDDIFPILRRSRQPLALVRRGQDVVGLVTTEDILEEIVGEL